MCGVLGIISRGRDVIGDAIILLNAENNRGEQACGAAVFDGKTINYLYGDGKVSEVFGSRDQEEWSKLVGSACVMHCLYSTVGSGDEKEQPKTRQPVPFIFRGQPGAISHNGNLVKERIDGLKEQARQAGYTFISENSDTEVIAALLSTSEKEDFFEALVDVLKKIEGKGSFSLVILYGNKLYGVRDQNWIRPLCIIKKHGEGTDSDSYILASESSVFPNLEATRFVRDVGIGELVVLGADGIERSEKWTEKTKKAYCICELIYSMNPASRHCGVSAYAFRVMAGEISAKYHPVNADMVSPIPESGRGYDRGFSSVSGIANGDGFVKNRYSIGGSRTFMKGREVDRGKQQPLQANPDVMREKNMVLLEDSLFRASVAPKAVKMAREHGLARAVHLRICSPPVRHCCHLGIDTHKKQELIASHMTPSQICSEVIHADSLEYLSIEELRLVPTALGLNPDDFCWGCFTGEYPVPPPDEKQ
jgi:amidophosphoribosyltransferase